MRAPTQPATAVSVLALLCLSLAASVRLSDAVDGRIGLHNSAAAVGARAGVSEAHPNVGSSSASPGAWSLGVSLGGASLNNHGAALPSPMSPRGAPSPVALGMAASIVAAAGANAKANADGGDSQAAVANAAANAASVAADGSPVIGAHSHPDSEVADQKSAGEVGGGSSTLVAGPGPLASALAGPVAQITTAAQVAPGIGALTAAGNSASNEKPVSPDALVPNAPPSADDLPVAKEEGSGDGGTVVGADVGAPARDPDDGGSLAEQPDCDEGPCLKLGEYLLEAVEGPSCRALLITGRCPKACTAALAEITGSAMWPACATSCRKDIVEGAAERWAEMCKNHEETYLEQGKDVVKKIVGSNSVSGGSNNIFNFVGGLAVVAAALFVGYARGSSVALQAYRAQRRHRLPRKLSDPDMRQQNSHHTFPSESESAV